MAKSMINILQEHCILKYKKYPDYLTKDTSSAGSPQFTVECSIAGTRSAGVASSKVAAKTQAAEQMLFKLGLSTTNNNLPPRGGITLPACTNAALNQNYVGAMNEYCSKNNYPYPEYIEGLDGSTFVTQCRHQQMMTSGKGSTKKIAKQDSAKAMLQLCTNKKANNFDDKILMDMGAFSLQSPSKPDVVPSVSPNSMKQVGKFVPPRELDSVSAMNVYCDRYGYKKPEYFDCGKDSEFFTTKCVYQSYSICGKGVTTKFAKQDSARQMLEMLGVRSRCAEENLIDINDNSAITVSPSVAHPLDNKAVIDLYKKNSQKLEQTKTNYDVEDLIEFFANPNNKTSSAEKITHPQLQQILTDNKVKYDIVVTQNGDPWIVSLAGKRLMNDGQMIERTLVEMGDKHADVVVALLAKAIKSFKCSQ